MICLDAVRAIPLAVKNTPSKDMVLQQVCTLNVQNAISKLVAAQISQRTWTQGGRQSLQHLNLKMLNWTQLIQLTFS
jgi:hypothetical protein